MTEQLVLDLPQREAMGRDAFLVTHSNHEAVNLIDACADWDSPIQWIYGPSGSGKSHLAAVMAQQVRALLLSSDSDMPIDKLADILSGNVTYDVVIIDPIDALTKADEETLFHMFNHSKNTGSKLLLLSEAAPAQIEVSLPDLASRMKAVPAVALHAPDDNLLRGLMGKLFADRQVAVEARVVDYLLPRVQRDYAIIKQLVAEIDRTALAQQRRITVPLVAEILDRHINEI